MNISNIAHRLNRCLYAWNSGQSVSIFDLPQVYCVCGDFTLVGRLGAGSDFSACL